VKPKLSVPGLGGAAVFHRVDVDFILPPAMELGVIVPVVSAPESIDITNLFQSESVGTCQPGGQIFLYVVLNAVAIPLAAYQLYRNP